MTHKIPKTAFSTALSGSARTTEERIRNIFRRSKRRPPVLAIILTTSCILLCGSLVSCQTVAGSSTPPASSTNQSDNEFTIYKYHDFSVAIPNQFLDQLIVNEGSPTRNGNEVIVTVHEKASVEAGKADGMEDGLGLLFNIVCFDRTEYESILADGMGVGGITFFAKNEDTYFAWGKATDVQLYRDNGVLTDEDFETWVTLSEMSTVVQHEFISRNNLQSITDDPLWNSLTSLVLTEVTNQIQVTPVGTWGQLTEFQVEVDSKIYWATVPCKDTPPLEGTHNIVLEAEPYIGPNDSSTGLYLQSNFYPQGVSFDCQELGWLSVELTIDQETGVVSPDLSTLYVQLTAPIPFPSHSG